jgi:hypothetical protein
VFLWVASRLADLSSWSSLEVDHAFSHHFPGRFGANEDVHSNFDLWITVHTSQSGPMADKGWTQRRHGVKQYAWWVDGIHTTLRESDDSKLCLMVIIGVTLDGTSA